MKRRPHAEKGNGGVSFPIRQTGIARHVRIHALPRGLPSQPGGASSLPMVSRKRRTRGDVSFSASRAVTASEYFASGDRKDCLCSAWDAPGIDQASLAWSYANA